MAQQWTKCRTGGFIFPRTSKTMGHIALPYLTDGPCVWGRLWEQEVAFDEVRKWTPGVWVSVPFNGTFFHQTMQMFTVGADPLSWRIFQMQAEALLACVTRSRYSVVNRMLVLPCLEFRTSLYTVSVPFFTGARVEQGGTLINISSRHNYRVR